jgi:conjugal transfer ATP-binding protein TraC
MKTNAALVDKLDVWGFEEGRLIFKDFSLGQILEVSQKDISTSTDEFLTSLHSGTCDFLNGLPSGLSIQFVQMVTHQSDGVLSRHESGLMPEAPVLARELLNARLRLLRNEDRQGLIPNQKLFVVLRRPFVRMPKRERRSFKFWKKDDRTIDWSRAVLVPELKLFKSLVGNVKSGFESIGITARDLNEEETFALLFDQWNPSYLLPPPQFDREDFRDHLLLSDLILSHKGFVLSGTHHRILSLKIMPQQTFASMSERMRDLPFDSKLFLTIEVLDQAKEDFVLQTQRRISYAMHIGKKGVTDLESEAKLQDIEALLEARVNGETKIFNAALNIVLRAQDETQLDSQVEFVLQKFRELSGAEGMLESLAATSIFLDLSLPNARARERTRRMHTEVLSDFLPLFGDWKGHEEPRVLLRNREGSLVSFDPFSPTLTNFNQIVSGGSGAGKSFLTNCLIAQLMKEDPKVFIIDIGGSYKKITENLGGQYIALGNDSSLSLNPFDVSEKTVDAVDQKIKFLTALVELMTKEIGTTGIGRLERSEIELTIKSVMDQETRPRLSQLRERLLQNPEPTLQKIGKILGPWVGDATYGKFVDRETNLKLDNKIVCFDLKGMESQPDLQAVCLFLITDLIWREVQRDRTSPKFVIFDECWSLLENEAGARFLGEVFRTFRKYRASAIAISQTMDDFANSKVASAILPNASVKWLMKQTGGNLPSLQNLMRFNEREIRLVESVTSKKGYYSEAFLVAGDDKQVVKLESTPLEYWLATTDPMDLRAIDHAVGSDGSLTGLGLLTHMAEKYPNGALP